MNDNEFIKEYNSICDEFGIKIRSVGIAQAIIETGHFSDRLSEKYNNCFGIKFHSSPYVKNGVNMRTFEYINGTCENMECYFSVYENIRGCCLDYFVIVGAYNLKTVDEYLKRLKTMGYATSPQYINLIKQVIYDFELSQYDRTETSNNLDLFITAKIKFEETKSVYDLTLENVARDVIMGLYGNGEERKSRLGVYYDEIQNKVNELL